MMSLTHHSESIRWVAQFDQLSKPAAKMLLTGLSLISFAEFERYIAQALEQICRQTNGRVAVFTVDPTAALTVPTQKRASEQIRRLQRLPPTSEINEQISLLKSVATKQRSRASSAGRISHSLKMLERRYYRRIRLNPTEQSMRAERCRHVVIVDDLIGSGQSLVKFWNAWITKTMRSWLSYQYCRLWLVAYAAHRRGLESVKNRIGYAADKRILLNVEALPSDMLWNQHILRVCDAYATRTKKAGLARGYGNVMSPFVFQHGCPNDAPVILWCHSNSWRALFPNRMVPPEMFDCFSPIVSSGRIPEILWKKQQPRLALAVLDALAANRSTRDTTDIVALLALLQRGISAKDVGSLLLMSSIRVETLLAAAETLSLVDPNSTVTSFGKELVESGRKGFRPLAVSKEVVKMPRPYYPQQFKGVQQKSSM